MNETTVSGSIAAGPAVGLGTQRRVQEEDSDDGTKAPDAPKAKEFGLWKNSVLAGAEQQRDKKKSKKVAESLDEERGKMSSFRQNIISQQEQVMKNIARDPSLDDAQREYLMMINDPKGIVFRASYSSFPKGQAAREQVLDQISKKYNIDSKHLEQADQMYMMKSLNEQDVIESKSEDRNEMDTPAVQSGLKKMADRHNGENWTIDQLAALGKKLSRPVKDVPSPIKSIRHKDGYTEFSGIDKEILRHKKPNTRKHPTNEKPKVDERDYGAGQRQLNLAEENISEEQLLAKELARRLDLFMKGLDRDLGKKSSDRGIQSKTEPSTGAMREGDESADDINQIASQLKFLPTTKQPKQYKFIKNGTPGRMPAMTYTVSTQEQPVVTITSDGKETQNVAASDDIIMSGPSKENYVIKSSKFPKLYQGNVGGTVIPEQGPRLVALYTGKKPITFMASWGESMVLKPGDYLVKDGDNYYRIAKVEYEQTYNQPGSTGQQDVAEEGKGLWANIHAKQNRIKNGSGEHMRKPGSKGAPTKANFKSASKTEGVAEDAASVKYGVFSKGGSVGDQKWKNDPIKTFDNKEEAIAFAKHRRAGLSKGEKAYYRMSYVVKPIKNTTEKQVNEHGDPWEDPNYDPRGGGETRSPEQIAKDNAEHEILSKKLGLSNKRDKDSMIGDMTKMLNHFMGQHSKKKGVDEAVEDHTKIKVDSISSKYPGTNILTGSSTVRVGRKGKTAIGTFPTFEIDGHRYITLADGNKIERALKQDVAETTGDTSFDSMMGKIVKGARYKGAKADQQADAAYGDMMNNITKNAADVAKPSTNSKFEQVYSAVEKILLSSNVHWDIDDDISDALAKLKIKANDKLIQKLERELINRVSDALQFYDDSDLMTEATGYNKVAEGEGISSTVHAINMKMMKLLDKNKQTQDPKEKHELKSEFQKLKTERNRLLNIDPKDTTTGALDESTGYKSQFPSAAPAIQYAKDKVKTFRDSDDGIEIWSMPDGGCDVVHTSNSNGRNHCIDNRGKKLGTIRPQKQVKETSNYGDLDEVAPPHEEKLVKKLKKEYPGHPEKAFATAWSIHNKKHGKK